MLGDPNPFAIYQVIGLYAAGQLSQILLCILFSLHELLRAFKIKNKETLTMRFHY